MPAEAGVLRVERAADSSGKKIRIKSLGDLDRRTRAAQMALKLRDELIEDRGGADRISAAERVLIDNAAVLYAAIQAAATGYLSGQATDLGELVLLVNAQRRLLTDLGLDRVEPAPKAPNRIIRRVIIPAPESVAFEAEQMLGSIHEQRTTAPDTEADAPAAPEAVEAQPYEPLEGPRAPGITREALDQIGPGRGRRPVVVLK